MSGDKQLIDYMKKYKIHIDFFLTCRGQMMRVIKDPQYGISKEVVDGLSMLTGDWNLHKEGMARALGTKPPKK